MIMEPSTPRNAPLTCSGKALTRRSHKQGNKHYKKELRKKLTVFNLSLKQAVIVKSHPQTAGRRVSHQELRRYKGSGVTRCGDGRVDGGPTRLSSDGGRTMYCEWLKR